MRRLALLIAGGAVWLFLFAIPAFADNGPHVKGSWTTQPNPASCAGCHRTHSAKSEDILKDAQPALCYQCHGAGVTGAMTDVQDGQLYSSGTHSGTGDGALKGGGFDYALINTNGYTRIGFGNFTIGTTTAQATTSSHSVNGSAVTSWGWGAPGTGSGKANVNLTCGSCHDPHGTGTYRILKPAPSDTDIATSGGSGGRVYINDGASKTYVTSDYGTAGIQVDVTTQSTLNSDGSALWYSPTTNNWYGSYTETSGRWCATCHTRYMAPTDSAIDPAADPIFTFRHAVRNIVDPTNSGYTTTTVTNPRTGDGAATIAVINPLTAGSGVTGTTLNALGTTTGSGHVDKLSFSAPKCITCHVSHGSNAGMASSITSQSSPLGAAPAPYLDGTLLRLDNRGVCEACHNK